MMLGFATLTPTYISLGLSARNRAMSLGFAALTPTYVLHQEIAMKGNRP